MASNRLRLKPLHHQVLLITGATSGIGLATARQAAERGAALFLVARSQSALDALVAELHARGAQVAAHAADVGVEAQLRAAADACREAFGGWDTWINDAGVSIFGPVRETPLEDHRRLFDTNYWGVVHGSLIAVEALRVRPGGGVLINVGSTLADAAIPVQGAYAASQHAVKGFTEALRMEMIRERAPVAITLIKASAVDTPWKDHARNLTDSPVKNPPPVYAAPLAAEAILYCAEHRVREITVGFGGRAVAAFHNLVPSVAEPLFARVVPGLYRDRLATRRETHDGLYEPGPDLKVRSDYARVYEKSPFTDLQMHPLRAVGGALAVGAVAGALGLIGKLRRDAAGATAVEVRGTRGPRERGASGRIQSAKAAPAGPGLAVAVLAATVAGLWWTRRRKRRERTLTGEPLETPTTRPAPWVEVRP